MPYLNSVLLMGHLTADPELRHLPSGEAVASFSIGVNTRIGNGKPDRAEFFNIDVWGAWAENLVKTARKGSLVLVEGRLAQDRWIDQKTRENRSRVKVRALRSFHVVAQYGDPRAEAEPAVLEGAEG